MIIDVTQVVFYSFSTLLVMAAFMVIVAKNPVHAALFLVFSFFASSVLWMLLEAEFLALGLIFVYVGAVMTLFVFVVMMLNVELLPKREGFVQFLPFGLIIMCLLLGLMMYVIGPQHYNSAILHKIVAHPADYSNVKEIGSVLYTEYFYPFEIAAVLLLVAIISAISLAFRGKQDRKSQNIAHQHSVRVEDRVYLTKMESK